MLPRGGRGGFRYASGHGMPDAAMRGVGGVVPSPYEMGRMTLSDAGAPQQVPIGALASALANSPPEQQRLVSLFLHFCTSCDLESSQSGIRIITCIISADAW